MKIYLASSWRNPMQPAIVTLLRTAKAVAARYERDGHFSNIRLQPFVTQDLVRLRDLDLTDYSASQRRLGFDNECAGVCGV